MTALPSMRCDCGHWDTEHAAFTRNIRPGKTRTFCDRCDCRSWREPTAISELRPHEIVAEQDATGRVIKARDVLTRQSRSLDRELAERDDQIDAGLGTGYIGEFR